MTEKQTRVILKDQAVSSTTVYYSDWVHVDQLASPTIHAWWTGTPTGAIVFELSNDAEVIEREAVQLVGAASDGTQGKRTLRGATSAAKKLTSVADTTHKVELGADPAGGAEGAGYRLLSHYAYFRLKYTNASGSGVLNAVANG